MLRIAATRQAVAVVPAPRTLTPRYARHVPERTLLYRLVRDHYPAFVDRLAEEGRALPAHVHGDFEEFLRCGRLEYGFLRVRCEDCHAERLVAFSCKRRGFCPSCGARRMAESARLLVEDVFGPRPVRQWALSFPFLLRFLFESERCSPARLRSPCCAVCPSPPVRRVRVRLKPGLRLLATRHRYTSVLVRYARRRPANAR